MKELGPNQEGLARKVLPMEVAKMSVGDNHLQLKLIELWAKSSPFNLIDRNAMVISWNEAGLAKKYRQYVEDNPNVVIYFADEGVLKQLLDDLSAEVLH